ncbi:hypothetical protein LRN_1729 [Ligilactobacillus ruminis DPC 6832]|uniref:Uncharacterized protein n=1 Tax=Ligilactobacillus ruminis DPC 6832 TaxID=1402208 RepID=A0A837DVW3_9LACO|nr:hypothetical protein [Ligilactobacillus ruminis]KIC05448.1 hypothetical protein LRN_1729 [Ligilactobacillus ruminis DPC 6832]
MLRILIDTDKRLDKSYPLPWKSDATCFNFKAPEMVIYPENTIEKITEPEDVESLVIACDLTDYKFISEMVNLTHLYIYSAENIKDLDFLKNLSKIRQLYLGNINVESLEGLVELIELKDQKYKEIEEVNDLEGRLTYGFEGIYIQSNKYEGDGTELVKPNICRNDIVVNDKRVKTGWFY